MINCELFSDVYFAALPIPRSCAYVDSLGEFGFRAYIGLQNDDRFQLSETQTPFALLRS